MLRIGVIGAGSHSSSSHGVSLAACRDARPGEVDLAAVCDLNLVKAQAYAQRFGFGAVCTDWRRMLAEHTLDGLVAVTPMPATCALACELLEAGIPLVIEKPPGISSAETQRLMDAARRTGTPHMLSFNRRFSPAVQRAQAWLARHGQDDPPRIVRAEMFRDARTEEDFAVGTGIHAVDTVLALAGRAESVTARQEAARRGWSLLEGQIAFADGRSGRVTIRPQAGVQREAYYVLARTYCIIVDYDRCRVTITDTEGPLLDSRAPEDMPASVRDGSRGETEAFLRALEGRGPFSPDLADGLAAMRVAEAIHAGDGG